LSGCRKSAWPQPAIAGAFQANRTDARDAPSAVSALIQFAQYLAKRLFVFLQVIAVIRPIRVSNLFSQFRQGILQDFG
jgi:hypothetical protein